MTVSELKQLSSEERAALAENAKRRASVLRRVRPAEFRALHPAHQKAHQAELSQCLNDIATIGFVQRGEL